MVSMKEVKPVCPLAVYICPAEYTEHTGRCAEPDKKVPVCIATANTVDARDGTGFRVDMLTELGWDYCISQKYRECPFYRIYSAIAPDVVRKLSDTSDSSDTSRKRSEPEIDLSF